MKLATFSAAGLPPRAGAVVGDELIDLGADLQVIDIVRGGAAALADAARRADSGKHVSLASIRLHAPIPQPAEFIIVGGNYRDHLEEAGMAIPSAPIVTNKQTSCVNGPFDAVVKPADSDQLDYEGELGIVIGHAGRHLDRAQGRAAIFGYVAVNDLSVRDWQFRSSTVTLGKSFDTHGPFGPWIVTADEIGDPQDLEITTIVNGEVRQRGRTADMIFDCCELVRYLSRVMTLSPGTVIATGTMAGVGFFRGAAGFLRVGDEVSVEISRIGRLHNRVIAESDRPMPVGPTKGQSQCGA